MKYIGAHVSAEGGVQNTPLRAKEIGARAFALFTRNASRWRSAAIKPKDAEAFRLSCMESGYLPDMILPHDSFLINLGSPDSEKLEMTSSVAANCSVSRC